MFFLSDLQGGNEQKPSFAVVTANSTERMTADVYLGLGNTSGKMWDGARGCNWKADAYLQEKNVVVTHLPSSSLHNYKMFQLQVGNDRVIGLRVSCSDIGPFGALITTNELLADAKSHNWPLKVIFLIGCCGGSLTNAKKKENWHGTVLLARYIKAYLDTGKIEAADTLSKCVPHDYDLGDKWLQSLQDVSTPCRRQGFSDIPVAKVHQYLSGPLVIKEQLFGDQFRVGDVAGVEMEAVGMALAKVLAAKLCPELCLPEVAVVKGISDYTGNKTESSKSVFFGTETEASVDDDTRQQIATFHAVSLVIRCVVAKIQYLLEER